MSDLQQRLDRLDRLLRALDGAGSILIMPHNDPDPDAIAASVALRHLLVERLGISVEVAYQGIIGRAENKALVRYLGNPLQRLPTDPDARGSAPVALVDTQPGSGNNALPPDSPATIVIDHHPPRQSAARVAFTDIRPDYGATSTILTEYLQAANIEMAPPLSTALFYGIKTDTDGLGRGASQADVTAYFYLQPMVDVEGLVAIEHAQVPADYFRSFDSALQAARVRDGVVTAYLGPVDYPDLAAEMADLLSRLERSEWVICLGEYKGVIIVSVRTRSPQGGAEHLVQAVVGPGGTAGGHGAMAGAQIPLAGEVPEHLAQRVIQRVLEHLNVPAGTVAYPII